jgi:dGTP triphosphohydrolase
MSGPGREWGGFEHNLQSLRVVDHLEERYPAFDGLNLSFETREGILKHCSPVNARKIEAVDPGGVAHRFLDHSQPSLEAQLCNLADEIAYNAHDIDDGVRSGLLTLEQLHEVELFESHRAEVLREYPALAGRRVLYETIRRMLSAQVYDVISATREAIRLAGPRSADEARQLRPWCCSAPRCASSPPRSSASCSPTCIGMRRSCTPPGRPSRWCASCFMPISLSQHRCPPSSPTAPRAAWTIPPSWPAR